MSEIRSRLRAVRDQPLVNWGLRTPFRALRRLGVSIPSTLTQHLVYRGLFEVSLQNGRHFRMRSHGHKVENNLYWHGIEGHEWEALAEWIGAARHSRTTLDIGANTGLYALAAAAAAPTGGRVIAFEVVDRIATLCRENTRLNPDFDIEVLLTGIGETRGTATLHDPGGDNAYSASLSPDFLHGNERTSYEVPVVSVDDLLDDGTIARVDLIKLDVEGCEAQALRGMKRALASFRPTMIIEYLANNDALTVELTSLMDAGFSLYWLTDRGRIRQTSAAAPPLAFPNVLVMHDQGRTA